MATLRSCGDLQYTDNQPMFRTLEETLNQQVWYVLQRH